MEISDGMVVAFIANQANALGYSAEPDGSYMRMWLEPASFERVRDGLAAALVASGWRPEGDVLREYAKELRRRWLTDGDESEYGRGIRAAADDLDAFAGLREQATALEQAGALPVADGPSICSAHQVPDPGCRLCNVTITEHSVSYERSVSYRQVANIEPRRTDTSSTEGCQYRPGRYRALPTDGQERSEEQEHG